MHGKSDWRNDGRENGWTEKGMEGLKEGKVEFRRGKYSEKMDEWVE